MLVYYIYRLVSTVSCIGYDNDSVWNLKEPPKEFYT